MLTRYEPDAVLSRPDTPSQEVVWAQEQLNSKRWGTVKECALMVGKHYKTIVRLIEKNNPHIAYRITDMGTIVYIPSVFSWYHKEFPQNDRPTNTK